MPCRARHIWRGMAPACAHQLTCVVQLAADLTRAAQHLVHLEHWRQIRYEGSSLVMSEGCLSPGGLSIVHSDPQVGVRVHGRLVDVCQELPYSFGFLVFGFLCIIKKDVYVRSLYNLLPVTDVGVEVFGAHDDQRFREGGLGLVFTSGDFLEEVEWVGCWWTGAALADNGDVVVDSKVPTTQCVRIRRNTHDLVGRWLSEE